MASFTLDDTKWKPARKSFRYSNLVGAHSTKNGKLYQHFPGNGGWKVYVDPEHVYWIDNTARIMRGKKETKG